MPSERVQRQIDRLLDEAEAALGREDWEAVASCVRRAIALDPENQDARAYLAAAERSLGVTGSSAAVPPAAAFAPPTHAPTPVVPTSFAGGRYQVVRFLGEGGKKKVYLAHDTLLDRDVAFALIKTEGLDVVGRQRITREAQAMGRLGSHPHIVSVFDLGEEPVADAIPLPGTKTPTQPFMVTELMGGGDVEGAIEKAENHKLPLERALEIATHTVRGLEFAHSKGVVHRDLKPGNVWLTADGVAKIGDFGLAVAIDRSRLTREGMMVGTVSYMPPEQATGGEITPRSDLYSLGAMLYEMVCGRPPFVGDDSVAIIGQHLNTPPVSPSWHRPEVPPALENLILHLLEKDPGKRPESATAVRQALESVDLSQQRATTEREAANPLDRLARGVFVDREQELERGHLAVEEALSGRVNFLLLTGVQGIGKTRLAEEIATYASLRGAVALWGFSYPDQGAPPYWPWVQALRGYVQTRDPERLQSELGSSGPEVAKVVSELRERLPGLPQPTPGDPAQERFRLFDAITTFLRNASSSQPLVIILDNIEFADQPTLLLAQFLLQEAGSARLLLIGTYREVETGRQHPVGRVLTDLATERRFHRMPLRGLPQDAVARMLEGLTGVAPAPSLLSGVYQATEGVPFYIEEMVRLLAEEGRLEAAAGQLAIPQSVREIIGRRLERLSADVLEALTLVALVGREFDFALLRELTGKDEESLLELLEGAVESHIIEEVPGARGRYRFDHGLTRETLVADLSTTRRVRLHGRIGEALERVYGLDPSAHPELVEGGAARGSTGSPRAVERHAAELAFHFGQAATLTSAQEKAVRYAALAAHAAEGSHAYEEAIRHYEAALSLMDETGQDFAQDRIALLRGLATAQRHANLIPEAFRNFRRAFRLAQERGDGQATAELALEQVRVGFVPIDLSVRILTEALPVVPDSESELAAAMHAELSLWLFVQNKSPEADKHRREAELLATTHGYGEVLRLLAIAELGVAFFEMRLDELPELRRRFDNLERPDMRIVPSYIIAITLSASHLWAGDLSAAQERIERLLEQARRGRNPALRTYYMRVPAVISFLRGEFDRVPQMLDLDQAHEPDEFKEMARAVLAELAGDVRAARDAASAAVDASSRLRIALSIVRETLWLASLERRTGNTEKGRELYAQALRTWDELPPEQQFTKLHRTALAGQLALEAAARGDTNALARCHELLEPYHDLLLIVYSLPIFVSVDRCHGTIAAAQACREPAESGRWEEAVDYLQRSADFCQEKGLVVELAHCRLALSDALLRRSPADIHNVHGAATEDDRHRALSLLDQALADYRRLGMPLYVNDAVARRDLLKA